MCANTLPAPGSGEAALAVLRPFESLNSAKSANPATSARLGKDSPRSLSGKGVPNVAENPGRTRNSLTERGHLASQTSSRFPFVFLIAPETLPVVDVPSCLI